MHPERVALLAAFLTAVPILILLWRGYHQYRMQRLAAAGAPETVRSLVTAASPAILYFTTQDCAQCRFQQSPILERLTHQARVAVYAVDAVAHQDLASFYGVMTVPSTVVLNTKLQPVAINHGLATSDRLVQQVSGVLP